MLRDRVNLAHGMGTELVSPTWPALTPPELDAVFGDYPDLGRSAKVTWISPRPFSSAALARTNAGAVFVKRHHVSVRTPAELAEEHGFMRHLRQRQISVPRVLSTDGGLTAVARGDWTYEVHEVVSGVDRYRDALSWTPFQSTPHAEQAGALLGRLHLAAQDYAAPARQTNQLISRFELLVAADPVAALADGLPGRPLLAAALANRAWQRDFEQLVVPRVTRLPPLEPRWTHNDWHASNLLWSAEGQVSAVIDFGLANRTTAIFDLATALERNTIGWLSLQVGEDPRVHLDHAKALMAGYLSEAALTETERAALIDLLPIVHVEFALSELEYFHGITGSAHDADLAYDSYLLGHIKWFDSAAGRGYLGALQ